jgi:alpha-D-xyloside xylohydrolase
MPVMNTSVSQALAKVRVYPSSDANFTLYLDDGDTYAYEKGDSYITQLIWNEASGKLTHTGAPAWSGSGDALV